MMVFRWRQSPGDADLLVFFDDDFFPDKHYLAAVEDHMQRHPRTVVVTGTVLADGINGPGLSVGDGRRIVGEGQEGGAGTTKPTFSGYGCNMVLRLQPLRQHGLRF